MGAEKPLSSVAVIGAGPSGVMMAAALKAENYFEQIKVFERRETAGGTWIFDASPGPELPVRPGKLPPQIDPPLQVPEQLPTIAAPVEQERYSKTPIYNSLTTNIPAMAMCFSDARFAYGPFPPHHVPRQYLENYVATHELDGTMVLRTTVEDLSKVARHASESNPELDRWKLTLRRYDPLRRVDVWWAEVFDAVIIANGHFSVPFIPSVDGLEEYITKYPGRVVHSKYYRSPSVYSGQKVLVIGNSESGQDICGELRQTAHLPVYNSRRHKNHMEGDEPPPGMSWKPVITRYCQDGTIEFEDGSTLGADDVDKVIYATGYRPSFPFWNTRVNGRPLYDYEAGKLVGTYQHTFFHDLPTLGAVGIQRSLTFRSFEYQAVALARVFSGRNAVPLPPVGEMRRWEADRAAWCRSAGQGFHSIENHSASLGPASLEWLGLLYRLAGLGTLAGDGRLPPALSRELRHALHTIRKDPGRVDSGAAAVDACREHAGESPGGDWQDAEGWVMVHRS